MKKLTATVWNTLIVKIEICNPVMVNGVKEQKLTVYYKFVGQINQITYKWNAIEKENGAVCPFVYGAEEFGYIT